MLRFKDLGVTQVLVGLNRVGIVGLREALKEAVESGPTDREAIIDLLMETLAPNNYIPDRQSETYRTALWREYLRYKGEDFRDLFSEIEVTIHGEAGKARDEFVEMLESVIAEFELKPVITYAPAGGDEPNPRLVIHGETIVRGCRRRPDLKSALRKTLSDW